MYTYGVTALCRSLNRKELTPTVSQGPPHEYSVQSPSHAHLPRPGYLRRRLPRKTVQPASLDDRRRGHRELSQPHGATLSRNLKGSLLQLLRRLVFYCIDILKTYGNVLKEGRSLERFYFERL